MHMGGIMVFTLILHLANAFFQHSLRKCLTKYIKKIDKMTAFVIHQSGKIQGICNLQRNVNPIYTEKSLWKKRI